MTLFSKEFFLFSFFMPDLACVSAPRCPLLGSLGRKCPPPPRGPLLGSPSGLLLGSPVARRNTAGKRAGGGGRLDDRERTNCRKFTLEPWVLSPESVDLCVDASLPTPPPLPTASSRSTLRLPNALSTRKQSCESLPGAVAVVVSMLDYLGVLSK